MDTREQLSYQRAARMCSTEELAAAYDRHRRRFMELHPSAGDAMEARAMMQALIIVDLDRATAWERPLETGAGHS